MKMLISIILILVPYYAFSQSKEIESLEKSLKSYKSGEQHYGVKHDKAYQLLSIDKYNQTAIFYLLSSFKHLEAKDSVTVFFNKLIEENPNDIKPFLIREQYQNYEGLSYSERIINLKKALDINSEASSVNFLLGKLYYRVFNDEYNKTKDKDSLKHFAESSIQYFTVLCKQNEGYKESLKYPLLQLANYLKDNLKIDEYENYNVQGSYFPVSAFVSLPKNWRSNYTVDVIDFISFNNDSTYYGIESAIFHINWYSGHLEALEEPILSDALEAQVYRFTYLPTFDHPIIISLENNKDSISLYWKVSDGAGGYEPGKIINKGNKTLTIDDWNKFEKEIEDIDFWNLPSIEKNISGTDGSQWILEGKHLGRYHVVDRWLGGNIKTACKKLINLTDLEINQEDLY